MRASLTHPNSRRKRAPIAPDGKFRFQGLRAGSHELRLLAAGHVIRRSIEAGDVDVVIRLDGD